MKTFKTLLSLFALVAVFSIGAFAQSTSGSADVTASATIVDAITVASETPLLFGDILKEDTPTISAKDANAGKVSVEGATGGQTLNIEITYPDSLKNGSTGLAFGGYEAAYLADGTDDPTTATAFTSLAGQIMTGSYAAVASETAYIYVGGQITNSDNGVANTTYSGTISVSVSYN